MKVTTIATMLAAYAATVQATITYELFDQPNKGGNKIQDKVAVNVCTLPAGWNDRTRSFIVANSENYNIVLTFYNDAGCKGTALSYPIQALSFFNRDTLPAASDKKISSFRYVKA